MKLYVGRDNRVRVRKEGHTVISYPRVLMEEFLGRKLKSNEVVHHKDKNPLNNDISNLEVLWNSDHSRQHSTKYFPKTVSCVNCGKEFVLTVKQQHSRTGNRNRNKSGPYCSKHCAGYAGK